MSDLCARVNGLFPQDCGSAGMASVLWGQAGTLCVFETFPTSLTSVWLLSSVAKQASLIVALTP